MAAKLTVVLWLGSSVVVDELWILPSSLSITTLTWACSIPGLKRFTSIDAVSNGAKGTSSSVPGCEGYTKSNDVSPGNTLADTATGKPLVTTIVPAKVVNPTEVGFSRVCFPGSRRIVVEFSSPLV